MEDMITVGNLCYNSDGLIGKGSFGSVYVGYFQTTQKVAIKRLEVDDLNNSYESIFREVEVMLNVCDHPNIIRYIWREQTKNQVFIATELCAGSLQDWIDETYKGPKIEEGKMLYQITKGLAYLHFMKIIHRDLKPNNILIFAPENSGGLIKPKMKIADFGFSKLLKSNQKDLSTKNRSNPTGTIGWIAPECYGSNLLDDSNPPDLRYDLKLDIFPLGCIFGYTLSKGKHHPFGDDPFDRAYLIKHKQIPALLVLEDLKDPYGNECTIGLIKSMIAMDPKERPTAEEVLKNEFFQNHRIKNNSNNEFILKVDRATAFPVSLENKLEIPAASHLVGSQFLAGDEAGASSMALEKEFFHYDRPDNNVRIGDFTTMEAASSSPAHKLQDSTQLHQGRSCSQTRPTAEMVSNTQELPKVEADTILQDEEEDWKHLEEWTKEIQNMRLAPSAQNNFSEDSSNLDRRKTEVLRRREFFKLCSSATKLNEEEITRFVELVTDQSIDVNAMFPDRLEPLLKLCRNYQHDNLINLVRLLRGEGADLKARTPDGYNVLQLVCQHQLDNVNLIQLLQVFTESADIDVDEETPDGWNPLTYLCVHYKKENLIDILLPLIESGANVDVDLKDGGVPFISLLGWTVLGYEHANVLDLYHFLFSKNDAALPNNINKVISTKNWPDKARQVVLPSEIILKTTNVEGTLLGLLVSKHHHHNIINLVRLLIENGANVNCKLEAEQSFTDEGITAWGKIKGSQILPMMCFTFDYNTNDSLEELVKLFLKNGADVNSQIETIITSERKQVKLSEFTSLHALCSTYRHDNLISLLRLLIQEGASVNAMAVFEFRQNNKVEVWEANPLHVLCEHYKHENMIDLVRLFIENGIDVNTKCRYGANALHLLCEYYEHENLFDLVVLLKENNIDLKAKTNKGYTASYILRTKNPAKDKMGRVIDFLPQDDPSTNCRLM